jgi:hypothetical protein
MKERASPIRCIAGSTNADGSVMAGLDWERLKYIYCYEEQFVYSS